MTSTRAREILILDDEPIVGDRLKPPLEKCGYLVETLSDSQQAVERLAHKRYDLLITDLKMSGPSGLDVLRFVREQSPQTRVIVITGYATAEQARESLKAGAVAAVRPGGIAVVNVLVEGTTYVEMFDPVRGHCLALEGELPRAPSAWRILDDRAEQFDAPGGTVKRFRTTIAHRSTAPG